MEISKPKGLPYKFICRLYHEKGEREMDFVQRKTADSAVDHFLKEASDREIPLVWDRYEGSLPQCGFCETGLNCRDCLQGPCISHPFRDQNKVGICGKDKDILGVHSFVRLVVQGVMGYLDQLADFAKGVEAGKGSPKRKQEATKIIKDIRGMWGDGETEVMRKFPKVLVDGWKATGVYPEGIGRDLFKISQKLDGGIGNVEDILLWAFKGALAGCAAQMLQGRLKNSVFGDTSPANVEVNLGVLQKESPNILFYGHFSPLLKQKIAEAAKGKKIGLMTVCSDPFIPPYSFAPVTNYGSQEIPLMTGAVDLIVAGDQCVNPSLVELAKIWKVEIVSTEVLKRGESSVFARQIVEKAQEAFGARGGISKDIPGVMESAVMGFSTKDLDVNKVLAAIKGGKIKGLAILAGCNNVKFTQDNEIVSLAKELLKRDVFCVSEGCASVSLAKYGFLNPKQRDTHCGRGLVSLLSFLGKNLPAVVDLGSCENSGVTDFLISLASADKKHLKEFPIVACFPEANRTKAVARAAWTVAMGIPTYFWPFLPVTGSQKTVEALGKFCEEKFGAKLHVITQKMEYKEKVELFMKSFER
jgi:carbon-monoxide dehydrogenase catalytic subunit